ncbi:hypothetical protein BpHYR1_036432 [Brachionus plicatilis]|uniref:Uncharacterized protein n=1 Tax=Brachionus plicatilis TaxID=10195 RepID=A0A3M7Q286_BRAPC|nr:hypothetical protein BpHYR1_036432 [Brachionus plicatilis]
MNSIYHEKISNFSIILSCKKLRFECGLKSELFKSLKKCPNPEFFLKFARSGWMSCFDSKKFAFYT